MDTNNIEPPQESISGAVDRVLATIIQVQDEKKATKALSNLGLKAVQFSSTGGFLGKQNVTLLISLSFDQIDAAIEVLQHTCHKRTEYVSTPLEGTPLPIPLSTPIIVGGATILVFKIDRLEEIY
jgi:uncharacterized protein YaaQ